MLSGMRRLRWQAYTDGQGTVSMSERCQAATAAAAVTARMQPGKRGMQSRQTPRNWLLMDGAAVEKRKEGERGSMTWSELDVGL